MVRNDVIGLRGGGVDTARLAVPAKRLDPALMPGESSPALGSVEGFKRRHWRLSGYHTRGEGLATGKSQGASAVKSAPSCARGQSRKTAENALQSLLRGIAYPKQNGARCRKLFHKNWKNFLRYLHLRGIGLGGTCIK